MAWFQSLVRELISCKLHGMAKKKKKRKKKSHAHWVGNSQTGKKIISQRITQRSESSEPHVRLPSLRVLHWEEEPPEHLAFKDSGA